MLTLALGLALLVPAQQPSETAKPDLATISARLGVCTADFTVRDAAGVPAYAATVHVRIRYGFMGLKRMDLEVGTNSEGKARVEGLPLGGRRLTYDITKDKLKTTVEQNLTSDCHATYTVSLE
ncbi:MAG: hypothetical protein A3I61_14940 [Acidobacteria bacterium RIFCSPLOWO2_02_FULL_68_18]|nr:MAG: hypothetical protein A3I61_14940 [Acidobacteria bacterium RIFCSPLOWO2_02_FULL_68_18]OFW50372.1 MAG: hypothetical protein A3G77_07885 [Acidobacteria bacterium RIFCSPLOWO2_12_FULL_68_19]